MLLEREGVLASLHANLVEAGGGSGRLLFVGGEAGVGKTSVTGEFARGVDGVRVLRGTSDRPPTAAPLGPFLDAIIGETPDLEGLLDRRIRLFPAVRSALGATPTLLVLEDLHWADEATLDLLGYLGRRLDGFPVLILGTFRDDAVGASHPLTILLGDLATRPGVARMHVPRLTLRAVRQLADDVGSPLDADELYGRTGGNPFFVTEVLAAGAATVPPSVRDATLARAARLSVPARRVLDAAAVIGGSVELGLLGDVAQQSAEAIDECCECGLLLGGARLEFRHELARQAVEEALPAATRAGLHAATLAGLLAAGPLDDRRLAYHAAAGGDAEAVLVHAPKAGDRAARLGAHREAVEQYRAALRHGDRLAASERVELLERLSYECHLTDQGSAAVDAQAAALELHREAGDVRRVGVALRWLSRLSWFLGRNADAERFALESLTTLEALEPGPELAMAYSNLSQLRMLADNTDEALSWGKKAIDLARAVGDRAVECSALNNVGTAMSNAGELIDGIVSLQRSLDIALAMDAHEHVARAYTNLGSVQVTHRRFADAGRDLRAGIAYCVERDLDSWRLYMSAWLAASLAEQGRWDAASQAAAGVLRHPHVSPISRMPALVVTARIATRRGSPEADAALDEALALAEPTGEAQRLLPVIAARAEAAWTAGRSVAGELSRAELTAHGTSWDLGELAWWAHRPGVGSVGFGSAGVGGVGVGGTVVSAGAGAGAASRGAEPFALMLSGRAAEAAAVWGAIGSPFWQALALTESDRAAEVRDGVEMLRSLGASATMQAVLRDLRAQGKPAPRGPRLTSRTNPAGLTDREFEVLALLATGLSNAEIAAKLYWTEKTAGHHVSAVLRKLGEPTRSRAVAAARRQGIVAT